MTTLELTIESLAFGGDGVARHDGRAVFVRGAAAGERLNAAVDLRERTLRGRLLSLVEASRDRVEPPCPLARTCGGCALMHLSSTARARYRAAVVEHELGRALGGLPADVVHHGSPLELGYRTRARFRVIGAKRPTVGFVEARGTKLVDVPACSVLHPKLLPVIDRLRALLQDVVVRGEARVALGRRGQPVVALSLDGDAAPALFARAEAEVADGRLDGLSITLAGAKTPAKIGDPMAVTIGADGDALVVPDGGFAQANPDVSVALGKHVDDVARAAGERMFELFSGAGNLTVLLAKSAARITAIESSADATKACQENLAARGLRATVQCGDADAVVVPRDVSLVVLDPPRSGAKRATDAIARSKVKRVVYVSCDPTTLARDAKALAAAGFRATSLHSFDMFPQTAEVETVLTLERPG